MTPQQQAIIIAESARGVTQRNIAAQIGKSHATVDRWQDRLKPLIEAALVPGINIKNKKTRCSTPSLQKTKRPKKNNRNPYNMYDKNVTMEKICKLITLGENLNRICRLPDYPDELTVKRWMQNDTILFNNYSTARAARADARSDRIDEICRETRLGRLDPAAARVIIEAEKWQAGKEQPKRYGDRMDIDHGGRVGLDITVIPIKFLPPDPELPET